MKTNKSKKTTKYKRQSIQYNDLYEYALGSWLKEKALPFAGDTVKRVGDNTLSLVGAGNVINEDDYKSNFFKKSDRVFDKASTYWLGNNGGVDWLKLDFGSGNGKTLAKYTLVI